MKNYIKVSGSNNTNYLRVDFDYSKGGYFMESYTAFSGVKDCIFEVTRASKKAENQAAEIFEQVKDRYINYILDKYGLTLEV